MPRSSVTPATGFIAVSTPPPRRAALTESGPQWTSPPVNVSVSVAKTVVTCKIKQRKWQKWCVVHVTKNNASATHLFALCPKPIARFRWKRARLSLFRSQPHLPSFIQIYPSFRDLLAKTTFQIVTVGDPIGADNNNNNNLHHHHHNVIIVIIIIISSTMYTKHSYPTVVQWSDVLYSCFEWSVQRRPLSVRWSTSRVRLVRSCRLDIR